MITGYVISTVAKIKDYFSEASESFYNASGVPLAAGAHGNLERIAFMSENCGCGETCKNPKRKGPCQHPQGEEGTCEDCDCDKEKPKDKD
ncbi:MAG: hypothetical protein PVJ67_06715 [Candidatus Pacearchaeota archaeon]|jgi:hypothetical protein